MTLRLTIDEQPWRSHIAALRDHVDGLVPVVKGNGYGFGRELLAGEAATLADEIAVGTVFEAIGLPELHLDAVTVLTPALHELDALPPVAVPTVGDVAHVDALRAGHWRGRVAIKLASSMQRYGATPATLHRLVRAIASAGLEPHAYLIHPPLTGEWYREADALAEIEGWLPQLDPAIPVSVSHLDPAALASLGHRHPRHRWRLRAGTALWHGDKTFLRLTADVVDVRPVSAGQHAGYRSTVIEHDGHLVMIGAGSAHGVTPLADGRSPFHFDRTRLALIEAPHMHTSMAIVPAGAPCPTIGDWVDVQRPLTTSAADELVWR